MGSLNLTGLPIHASFLFRGKLLDLSTDEQRASIYSESAPTLSKILTVSPTPCIEPAINIWTALRGHFVPSNAIHQTSIDKSARPNSHKREANLEKVCGRLDLHHVGVLHP